MALYVQKYAHLLGVKHWSSLIDKDCQAVNEEAPLERRDDNAAGVLKCGNSVAFFWYTVYSTCSPPSSSRKYGGSYRERRSRTEGNAPSQTYVRPARARVRRRLLFKSEPKFELSILSSVPSLAEHRVARATACCFPPPPPSQFRPPIARECGGL